MEGVRILAVAVSLLLAGALNTASGTPTYRVVDLNANGLTWSYGSGVGGGQQVGFGSSGSASHALLWSGDALTCVDLNPPGFAGSIAHDTNGVQQFGSATFTGPGNVEHALIWNGSADNYLDINPAGFSTSFITAADWPKCVGQGYKPTAGNFHALLWSGTAAFVDLNPVGFSHTYASDVCGDQQVGTGMGSATNLQNHALLWTGSPESCIDLNPVGFSTSSATAASGTQQIGYGGGPATNNNIHALIWNGAATDYSDLNPEGYSWSNAVGANETQQVGQGIVTATNEHHALVWFGSAADFVDLHQFMGEGFTESFAKAIDAEGNIVGVASYTLGNQHAILWQPVPEPATIFLLVLGGAVMARPMRKRPCRS